MDITSLGLSQNSALEIASELILQQTVIAEAHLDDETRPENDGTNACTFLALAICDSSSATLQGKGSHSHLSWTDIAAIADNIVKDFPTKINHLRNSSETYDLSDAKVILESNNLLLKKYQLTEECVSGNGFLSETGGNELCSALSCLPSDPNMKFGVHTYTCLPYAIVIGVYNNCIFLVDTHPIAKELDGRGNRIVVATKDKSISSCKMITQWLLKRLKVSGVNERTPQSLVWLVEDLHKGINIMLPLNNICGYILVSSLTNEILAKRRVDICIIYIIFV